MPVDLPKNRDVVRWMLNNSKRPHVAVQTWATVITSLDVFTGEILLTRREIATESNATPNEVSEIMSELVRYGAISRLRKGGRVHYSVITALLRAATPQRPQGGPAKRRATRRHDFRSGAGGASAGSGTGYPARRIPQKLGEPGARHMGGLARTLLHQTGDRQLMTPCRRKAKCPTPISSGQDICAIAERMVLVTSVNLTFVTTQNQTLLACR